MTDPHNISLVVSTYNWPQALELVLLGVAAQKIMPAEVLIADDGSSDETKMVLTAVQQKLPVPMRHVWQEDNGFRKTIILNKTIAVASGSYIVQIDGDVVPEKNFIGDHANLAEKGCFVRGTRAHLTEAVTREALRKKRTQFWFYSKGVKHRNNAIRSPLLLPIGVKRAQNSFSVRGSNLAFWKQDFINVNGYNNTLEGWGHEDEELAARFINSGLQKKKVKLAAIQYHLYHKDAARERESQHCQLLNEVRAKKIPVCINGLNQI